MSSEPTSETTPEKLPFRDYMLSQIGCYLDYLNGDVFSVYRTTQLPMSNPVSHEAAMAVERHLLAYYKKYGPL